MNSPNEKSSQTKDLEKQIRDQVERDKAGAKPGFDKDRIPQGGPSDNGPMTAPDKE